MSDIAELKGLVEGINKPLTELRGEVDALKEGTKDALTEEKFNKMAEEITAKVDALQQAQQKQQAILDRPGFGAEEKDAGKEELSGFLRKGLDLKGVEHSGQISLELRAMSTDVNNDGGYLVRPEFVNRTVSRIFETSPVRQVASVLSGSNKSIEMLIDDDEVVANSVGEGASSGETGTPDIGLKSIVAHKYDATPKMTPEMIADALFDVESWLQGKVTNKIARKENTDFVSGNGVNKARGFMTYDAWSTEGVYERDKIEQRNLGSAAALNADGLIAL